MTVVDSLRVRPMREDEIRPLAEAIQEMSEAQMANRWQEQRLGYREVYVAEAAGELVGTVSISEGIGKERPLHLFALEVAPARRSQGIGTAIIEHVIAEAERRGCRLVYLEVRVDNPARRLYHRLGFRRVGGGFVNAWYQFGNDGSRRRVEEQSIRMVRRVKPSRRRGFLSGR